MKHLKGVAKSSESNLKRSASLLGHTHSTETILKCRLRKIEYRYRVGVIMALETKALIGAKLSKKTLPSLLSRQSQACPSHAQHDWGWRLVANLNRPIRRHYLAVYG